MVDVNGAYQQVRCEKKNWLKSLHLMSNAKVIATQDSRTGGRPAGRTNTTHYLDPQDIHMVKKEIKWGGGGGEEGGDDGRLTLIDIKWNRKVLGFFL